MKIGFDNEKYLTMQSEHIIGCSIKTKAGMKKVCHDGPVFKAETIVDLDPVEKTETCCGN